MSYTNSGFKVTVTKPMLTSTNPKLTRNSNLNRTLLTKDPSTQYRYYGKLRVAATDGDDTASFMWVCFVKFICLSKFSGFTLQPSVL